MSDSGANLVDGLAEPYDDEESDLIFRFSREMLPGVPGKSNSEDESVLDRVIVVTELVLESESERLSREGGVESRRRSS